MYILKHVKIQGFWGNKNLEVSLHPDVNIFIGRNGTGKTTLINTLQACMTVDMQMLNKLAFDDIELKLVSQVTNTRRTIRIKKELSENFFDNIEYRISGEKFSVPILPRASDYRRRIAPRHLDTILRLKKKLFEISETSWLSVHRELLDEGEYETYSRGRKVEALLNPIDARLQKLLERLLKYQMELQTKANILSSRFQRVVLRSLLYNKKFDRFDLDTESTIDFDLLKGDLINAYRTLDVLNETTEDRIDNHINMIRKSIEKLLKGNEEGAFHVNDVLPLSLLKRSMHIASLSTKNEEAKKSLFDQLELFSKILQGFLIDKDIKLKVSKDAGIRIKKGDKILEIADLSSGEKQVFIILAETLLQEKNSAIFLADEPELSLHIEWQQKLLPAIRSINPNSQMIVATHSPEIAGSMKDRLIDMEDLLAC